MTTWTFELWAALLQNSQAELWSEILFNCVAAANRRRFRLRPFFYSAFSPLYARFSAKGLFPTLALVSCWFRSSAAKHGLGFFVVFLLCTILQSAIFTQNDAYTVESWKVSSKSFPKDGLCNIDSLCNAIYSLRVSWALNPSQRCLQI